MAIPLCENFSIGSMFMNNGNHQDTKARETVLEGLDVDVAHRETTMSSSGLAWTLMWMSVLPFLDKSVVELRAEGEEECFPIISVGRHTETYIGNECQLVR